MLIEEYRERQREVLAQVREEFKERLKELKNEKTLCKLLKMADEKGGAKRSDVMRAGHLRRDEMDKLAEMAVRKSLIRVILVKGATKPMTVYQATGKEFEPVEFTDITDEYWSKTSPR